MYFTARSLTSTVNSFGRPTTVIEAALAAMPVQRRVSLATVLLAIPTLRLAASARNPVADVVIIVESAARVAPTPTKRFTLVRSMVRRSTETVPLPPNKAPFWVLLPKVN